MAENNRLRERVDELQAALALSAAPRPGADAYCQAGSGGGLSTAHIQGYMPLEEPAPPMPSAAPALLPTVHHPGAVMAATSLASWPGHVPGVAGASLTLGRAATGYGPSDNLLRSYNAIPEADPTPEELLEVEEGGRGWRGGGGFRPLRFMFGLVLKGTLVAGGMAAGIALGNPKVKRDGVCACVAAAFLGFQPPRACASVASCIGSRRLLLALDMATRKNVGTRTCMPLIH